ncbi:MAG TPA: cation-translocating P-type ATPase [Limnochordales bacterium]
MKTTPAPSAVGAASSPPSPASARLQLPLGELLPGVPARDACGERLAEALRRSPGIQRVELELEGEAPTLSVRFDGARLTRTDVAALARSHASRILRRFRHERLQVEGMDCPECARAVEHVMARLDGIGTVMVDYDARSVAIEYDPSRVSRRTIRRRLGAMGYRVDEGARLLRWGREHPAMAQALGAALAAAAAWLVERLLPTAPASATALWATSYGMAGWPILRELARRSWRQRLDVHVLMLLAAVGSVFIGALEEGAVLLVLFGLAHSLEHLAEGRARSAIRTLGALTPRTASRVEGGAVQEVPVEALRRGDRVRIRPGERIPVDGTVLEGRSAVDQSAITGESEPVEKAPGSPVFAGTVNGSGVLEVEVSRLSSESTLARMARLVEAARFHASPAERLAARIASILVPVVLAGAAAVATFPPLMGWLGWHESLYRAMALLVAASPCALAVGAPVAGVAAVARAARLGLVVKGSAHLEDLGRVRAVAFDKTGTLTLGRPEVRRIQPLDGADLTEPDGILALAASAEAASTHPLARAVVRAAEARGLMLLEAHAVRDVPGQGVEALIRGQRVRVGSLAFATGATAGQAMATDDRAPASRPGETDLFVSVDGRLVGVIGVADPVRPEAPEAIRDLRRLGVRHVAVVSGDRPETVELVARQVGADSALASLLPADKVEAIRTLERRHGPTAMVGDGVNDAPALAAARVGIAMGAAGSDTALEAAPAALLGDNLRLIPQAVGLGRALGRVVLQNHLVAVGVMVLLAVAAVSGHAGIGPVVAIHEASTVAVAFNALRLLRWRPAEGGQ